MLASLLLALPVLAEDTKPEFPTVKPGGLIFAHYGFDLTDDHDDIDTNNNQNSFDLDRAYLTATAQITKRIGARLTFDAGRGSDVWLAVFVKHAWIEGKEFIPGVKARFGVVDTGYLTYSEQFFGHRYLFRQLGDERKLGSTADLGVNVQGEHLGGLVSWHIAAINGEGYKALEDDQGKTLQARLAVDPLAKNEDLALPIVGFISRGFEPEGVDPQTWYAAGLGFKYKKQVTFWGEYNGASVGDVSSSGISAAVAAGAPKYAMGVARFDTFDPAADVDDDGLSSFKIGVEHDFAEKVSAALMYERAWAEQDPEQSLTHGIFVRAQAGV